MVWAYSLQCSPINGDEEFRGLQFKKFKLHLLLTEHQTALGVETSC